MSLGAVNSVSEYNSKRLFNFWEIPGIDRSAFTTLCAFNSDTDKYNVPLIVSEVNDPATNHINLIALYKLGSIFLFVHAIYCDSSISVIDVSLIFLIKYLQAFFSSPFFPFQITSVSQ